MMKLFKKVKEKWDCLDGKQKKAIIVAAPVLGGFIMKHFKKNKADEKYAETRRAPNDYEDCNK